MIHVNPFSDDLLRLPGRGAGITDQGKANPVSSAGLFLVFSGARIDSDDVATVDEEGNLDVCPRF